MHIGLLTNYNLYESKRYFCEHFKKALENFGAEVTFIDMAKINEQHEDVLKISNPAYTDFTCSFNSLIPTDDGTFIADKTGVPHLSFLVDPAFYYANSFKSKNTYFTCVDHFDCDYIKKSGKEEVLFWGHAVEKELKWEGEEKIYDIVLIGSCYDHETLRAYWQKTMGKEEVASIEEAIELVIKDNKTPIHEAITRTLLANGYKAKDAEDFRVKIQFYGTYVDNYVRGKDRTELIKALSHRTVHVFGGECWRNEEPIYGWEHSLKGVPNVVIHKPVDFAQSLEILKRSKICLNSMPFFKNGTHERLFTGLACECLPLTSDNLWVRQNFKHKEDLLIYRPQEWKEVSSLVDDYLEDEILLEEAVQRGRQKVMEEHTWDKRVEQLMAEVNR